MRNEPQATCRQLVPRVACGYSKRLLPTLRKDVFLLLGIVGGTLLAYGRHLDVSPAALHRDEAATVEQARSIAETGRDLEGRRLPFFFHLRDNVWTPPL